MLSHRSFPRYDLKDYQLQLELPELGNNELPSMTVTNASLGGLNISSEDKIDFKDNMILKIHYKKYHFNLNIQQVWKSKKDDMNVYGLKIKFNQVSDYKYWFIFIKSLHQLFLKSQSSLNE
jgi:hypothetical protein